MIMAWQKPPAGSLPCYSFGGMYRDCQDVLVARRVAKVCRQSHTVIPVDEKFLSRFSHYAERSVYLTDGCTGVSHAADIYVNEAAREIAPVRMTGNYGGEVLRRIRAFKPTEPLSCLFQPEILTFIRQATETYTGLLAGHPLSFAVFRQAPWHHYGLLALEQTQLSLRSPYLDNDLIRTVYQAPNAATINSDVCLRLIADGSPALQNIRSDRGFGGDPNALSAAIFRAFLTLTFKTEYAYDSGMPQSLARVDHMFSPLRLERLFLGRHKFTHYRVWYRDSLSEYVRTILLDSRTLSRPYLAKTSIECVVNGHLSGNRNYTAEIHQLLTLELLHRLFLDAN
jgi:asparagine synthase (glutamine-hydrolysing)